MGPEALTMGVGVCTQKMGVKTNCAKCFKCFYQLTPYKKCRIKLNEINLKRMNDLIIK